MTVFQRTPNLAVPMQQRPLSAEEQGEIKSKLSFIFKARTQNYGGYLDESNPAKTFDVPAEEREPFYESLLQRGGFAFLLGGYSDLLIDGAANHEAYKYWAKKTRARITDPRKRDILAPLKQYHPIGAKRCSMETDYFEQYNCDNVDVVGLRSPGTPSQLSHPKASEPRMAQRTQLTRSSSPQASTATRAVSHSSQTSETQTASHSKNGPAAAQQATSA